ncbi:hypothetical protein VNO77_09648 [Canavalia gladiata]|uniref:Uncharacterized protein n=1 Tax=Canavalia gladiata TaxID=3824 RepID=A0AAN9MEW5_CANGL
MKELNQKKVEALQENVKLSNKEIDFYFILDIIHPTATHSDARHHLHDLVTSINGVKDEFPGAELTLEIVENALNMFSDREKHFYHGFRHDNSLVSSNEISVSTSKRCGDIQYPAVPFEQRILKESNQVDQECSQQEFYNFEEERNINLFEPGQVWAVRYQSDEESFPTNVLGLVVSWMITLKFTRRAEIWALYVDVVVNEWVWNPEAFKGCKFQLIEMLSDY